MTRDENTRSSYHVDLELSDRSREQGIKFCSVPAGTAGIFRSVPKTGTEYVIKNSAFCSVLFRPEWPESGRNFRNGRNGRNR